MKFLTEKIKLNIKRINASKTIIEKRLTDIQYMKSGYKEHNGIPSEGWKPYDTDTCFTAVDEHYWFKVNIHTPKVDEGNSVYFKLNTGKENQWSATNPQGLVYINGHMEQALDTNHCTVKLQPDSEIELVCYYYTGMLNEKSYFIPDLVVIDDLINEFYYDLIVPFEAAQLLDEDKERIETLRDIELAVNMVKFNNTKSQEYKESIKAAEEFFNREFYGKKCGNSKVSVNCIGHTHIDIAWLWTLAQTKEKVQRSFSTVINLMKQYPEYKFMSSQAILYKYVKEYAPELYEEIKQRVKEGRWEVDGAMWLECDCNLSSGESMIRQILYGKQFMKEEFGVDSEVLWLPDTFGYSAAMPQILKKCGIKYFVTSKESWNDTNRIPHDTFMWRGIDSTEIFTNFMTAQKFNGYNFANNTTTYVSRMTPEYVLGTWARYQDKEFNDKTFMTYGFGDGGGGPTAEYLEYQRRMEKGLPGIPKTVISTAKEHLEQVKENFFANAERLGRMPIWVGELYLEFHRGTYTSIGKIKRNNRKAEFAVNKVELLSSMAEIMLKTQYPQQEIREIWDLILLNQFHDIVPGSSIKEVYEDSDKQYKEIFCDCNKIIGNDLKLIADNIKTDGGILVLNSTPYTENGIVNINGETVEVERIPAHGWKVIDKNKAVKCCVSVSENTISNEKYTVTFDEEGNISSLYDNRFDREIVKAGKRFNEIRVFEDINFQYQNWDINEYHKSKSWSMGELVSMNPIIDGTRAGMKIKRKYLNSVFEQTVWIYSLLDRIDFETNVDWHEHDQLVKAIFPINVNSSKATYDIQFGNVERPTHSNTSWDEARFEVCAHKWADVSDSSYGVSVINDSKYGYSCVGSEMALTLIKCSTYPNKEADQGIHEFTYSVLPHGGDFRFCTIPRAFVFNQPFDGVEVKKQSGALPSKFSFVSTASDNIVIDTVKKSEDGSAYIIRLFDAYNSSGKIKLDFGIEVKNLSLCDMLENEIDSVDIYNSSAIIMVNNYEIITLKAYI